MILQHGGIMVENHENWMSGTHAHSRIRQNVCPHLVDSV